jgi:hemolysin III
MFLLLGRTALFFMDEIYNFNIWFFWLILSGGLCYTIWVVFYALDKIYFFHFIWHIFVCSWAILHSIGIMLYLY